MSGQTITGETGSLRVAVYTNGRVNSAVECWDITGDKPKTLWVHVGRLASAKVRASMLDGVSSDQRADVDRLLMQLGIRVERAAVERATDSTTTHPFPNPEAWPDEVDGAVLLDAIVQVAYKYIWFKEDVCYDALAIWLLYTHVFQSFEHSPRLLVTSPERGSGKSTVFDVAEGIASHAWLAVVPSDAALYRNTDAFQPSLLIDEADNINWRDREGLVTLLNAGFKRKGALVPRCGREGSNITLQNFKCFAPVALASIGLPPRDTIVSRSVVLHMHRASGAEQPVPFREKHAAPVLEILKRRAVRWGEDKAEALTDSDPDMPVTGREADCWYPLVAIADSVGDEWPSRIRAACTTLTDQAQPKAVGEELLEAIRAEFHRGGVDQLFSEDLVNALNGLEGVPWGDWRHGQGLSKNKLATLLGKFGVHSQTLRDGARTQKGYKRASFCDVFSRYLDDVTDDVTFPTPGKPSSGASCDVVTFLPGGEEANENEGPSGSEP